MKENKRDKDITKEAVGDPAFYNDQIDEDALPAKTTTERKKGVKRKNSR